jgi:hypothetical protein
MSTIFIVAVVLGVIPAAAVRFGADSRDLARRDLRSLVA